MLMYPVFTGPLIVTSLRMELSIKYEVKIIFIGLGLPASVNNPPERFNFMGNNDYKQK